MPTEQEENDAEQARNDALERFSTTNTQQRFRSLYPAQGSPGWKATYLGECREGSSIPASNFMANQNAKRETLVDNAIAAEDRKEAGIDSTDFAYPEGDPKRKE